MGFVKKEITINNGQWTMNNLGWAEPTPDYMQNDAGGWYPPLQKREKPNTKHKTQKNGRASPPE